MAFLPMLVLAALSAAPFAPPVTRYTLRVELSPLTHAIVVEGAMESPSEKEKTFKFTKTIDHPIAQEGEDYARGFAETEGTIQAEGVFLSGASNWYPAPAEGTLVTFDLEATLPA